MIQTENIGIDNEIAHREANTMTTHNSLTLASSNSLESAGQDLRSRLPLGAVQLDPQGRVLKHHPLEGCTPCLRSAGLIGRNLFHDILGGTPFEALLATFKIGMVRREIHEFVTHRLVLEGGMVELSLRLYFHDRSGQIWAFLDAEAVATETLSFRKAA